MASRIAPTVAGCISDGVPPPKKMVETVRPGTRAAVAAISRGEGAHEARLIDPAVTHMAVEVAIGALRQAEGPVDIDPEGRVKVMLSIMAALVRRPAR